MQTKISRGKDYLILKINNQHGIGEQAVEKGQLSKNHISITTDLSINMIEK